MFTRFFTWWKDRAEAGRIKSYESRKARITDQYKKMKAEENHGRLSKMMWNFDGVVKIRETNHYGSCYVEITMRDGFSIHTGSQSLMAESFHDASEKVAQFLLDELDVEFGFQTLTGKKGDRILEDENTCPRCHGDEPYVCKKCYTELLDAKVDLKEEIARLEAQQEESSE